VGLRLVQGAAVDQRSGLGEPALWAGYPDGTVGECTVVLAGKAVNDVALGHGRQLLGRSVAARPSSQSAVTPAAPGRFRS
jgi:hypothetical protein